MTHLFKRLLAAIAVGITVGASAAAISMAKPDATPTRVSRADRAQRINVGPSVLIYHFTQRHAEFELHVTVVSKDETGDEDVFQTRIQMRDAQVFRMVLNEEDRPAHSDGDRVTFKREGSSLLVNTELASLPTSFASVLWSGN